jgi:5-methylcytosine-specific restriction endonuclease McrA
VPVSRGGSHELSNLRVLCAPCHRRRTGEEHGWHAKERRHPRPRPEPPEPPDVMIG